MKLLTSLQEKILFLLIISMLTMLTLNKKNIRVAVTSQSKLKSQLLSREILNFYATNAQNYASFARLAYCSKPLIQNLSCSFCGTFSNSYSTFFIHSITKENNRVFQFVIVFSDTKKEIVVSFSGPTSVDGNYFTNIYSNGFVEIKELGGIKVEQEYWEVYSVNMRQILAEKLQKISTERIGYTIIFVGHSFGGSLATLALYDLVVNNIITKTEQSPLLYTYGPLRIGDEDFVNRVNQKMKIVKILRKDDYVTRMPNCVFNNGRYNCFNKNSNQQPLVRRLPMIKKYIHGYKKIFTSFKEIISDPIVRGTTFIGNQLYQTHVPMFYSQPFGTELIYNGPNFTDFQQCQYVDGVPACEAEVQLPETFSPDVHRFYYNMNIENC